MNRFCQIEYVSSSSDDGTPCGKPAVAECADCGASICSDCRSWCCGDSFCEYCYDYHVTHSCVRKPVQNESTPLSPFGLASRGWLDVALVLLSIQTPRFIGVKQQQLTNTSRRDYGCWRKEIQKKVCQAESVCRGDHLFLRLHSRKQDAGALRA
jgi:hypothetical protein